MPETGGIQRKTGRGGKIDNVEEPQQSLAEILPMRGEAALPNEKFDKDNPGNAPDHPRYLRREARDMWYRIWNTDVSRAWDPTGDHFTVARYIKYVDKWNRLMKFVDDEDELFSTGSTGQLVEHPAMKMARSLEGTIFTLEKELGLTPRSKQGLIGDQLGNTLTAATINKMVSRQDEDNSPSAIDAEGWEEV